MKRKFFLTLSLCLLTQWGMAQAPKWVEKAKQAVFSIATYDQNDPNRCPCSTSWEPTICMTW